MKSLQEAAIMLIESSETKVNCCCLLSSLVLGQYFQQKEANKQEKYSRPHDS